MSPQLSAPGLRHHNTRTHSPHRGNVDAALTPSPQRARCNQHAIAFVLCRSVGGHSVSIRMITNGAVDRAVHSWIADECGKSTVKNSFAILVRVMEQAVRDGIIDRNPARITGWQREYLRAEDELDDPRSLALPNWAALTRLATPSWLTPLAITRCGATLLSSLPARPPASEKSPAAA